MDKFTIHASGNSKISNITINSSRKPEVKLMSKKLIALAFLITIINNTILYVTMSDFIKSMHWNTLISTVFVIIFFITQILLGIIISIESSIAGERKAYNFINHSTLNFNVSKKEYYHE